VDASSAAQTLADLKNKVDEAAYAMDAFGKDADEGTAEFQQALVKLKAAQKDYNSTMQLTVNASKAAKGSYYDLNQQLVESRKAWKNLSEEERIADSRLGEKGLTGKIQKLDRQLKGMDSTIGQHQRNVGDYAGQMQRIAGLFGSAGSAATGAVSGVMGFKTALQAASATPIIAILGALVTIVQKVIDAFKTSETALNSITVAFAPFKAIGQATQVVIQKLAEWLGKVAEKLSEILIKSKKYGEAMKENQAIAREEIALREMQRKVTVENAQLEMDVSELRDQAADKINNSEAKRIELLKMAGEKRKTMLANDLAIAQKEYEIAQRKANLTHNDIAANDDLAEKQANLYRVQMAYNNGMRELTAQISEATKAQQSKNKADERSIELMEIKDEWYDKESAAEKERREEAKAAAEEQKLTDDLLAQSMAEADAAVSEAFALRKQEHDEEIAMLRQKQDAYRTYAASVADILGVVADAWNDNINAQLDAGRISEAEAERQFAQVKAFQYAQTLINTASGIMTVFAQPSSVLMGVKIAQAASVAATGVAQAIKIASTKLGSTTSASAATASVNTSAPAITSAIPYARQVMTAGDESTLNNIMNNQRVYILQSDIEAAGQASKVRVTETSF